jgi:hypothetical protein
LPARDSIHDLVKQALSKDGWAITADPYVISYGERFLFIDLAATLGAFVSADSTVIGAERSGQKIAVEIKEFQGKSVIVNLEQAKRASR